MKNMADAIESFIVGQLLAASKNTVLVQRNELADRLSCAPSQISYVLSTRFTQEEPTVDEILHYWHENRMLTDREFELLHYLMGIMDIPEREKRQILRQAVKRMVDAS